MRKISLCRLLLVAASSAIVTSQTASAADYWWDSNGTTAGFGNATGEWGVSDFWSSSSDGTAITAPVTTNSTDTVNFGTATLNYANAAVAVASAGVTVNSIVYGSGQTTAINLGTSGNVITLDGTTPTITVNHASVVQTISSPITGSSGVRKAGAGILTLGSANTYTGVTSVTAGTLNASTFANAGLTSSFGSFATPGATGITLNAATLNYSGGNITTDRGITFSGGANTTLSVANASTTLNLGDSVHSLSANAIVFNTPASSNIVISKLTSTVANMNFTTGTDANATINNMEAPGTFNIAVRTGTKAVNVGNITATSATTGNHWISGLNITGSVSVGAGATIFLGAGTPNGVTLTGSSNFNATVNIQQGGIYSFSSIKDWHATAPASSSLGAPTTEARGTIGFGNGTNIATLRYIGAGDTTNRVIHLRGSTGTVTLEQAGASGLLKFTAPMTAAAGAKIFELSGSTAGTGEIGGAIVNGSGTTSLRKIGTGTWTISSTNNSYTGTTTINAGTLALGDNDVIPNASNLSIGAATLNAATFTDTAGTLAITGAATMNLGSGAALVFADSNAVAWPGTLNIVGNFTSTSIRFGTTANGLTQAQIGKITVNDVGLGDYELDPSGFLITKSGQPDMTGPTPSPMTWTSAPAATSNSSITMTATTATDGSGVEYFFDETSENPGGTDSGWQNSSTYIDSGLSASTLYTYTVTARDKSPAQNASTASSPASATTNAPDTSPPTPNPMTWASTPAATSSSSITMTAATATDPSGVEYFFDETSGNTGGTDSGWQNSPTYIDSGLSASTLYTYTVTARDKSSAQTATTASAPVSATTIAPDSTPPAPNPMTWASVPAVVGNDSITMTATTASDASGVDYFFDETSGNLGGTDSGWQSSPTYTDAGLSPSTTYTYTVTARDRSTALNATTASTSASATTSTPPAYTVWNVQFASQSANQISTTDNFIGAATENTANSTWNRVASVPQTAMALRRSDSTITGVTLDFPVGSIGTQNLTNGLKIFNSRVNGNNTMSLKGLSIANSYDIVIYSDWWWKNGDSLPITQTAGTGLVGTFHLNRNFTANTGEVLALARDTNPANVTSGAGNTGNWMRVNGLTPTVAGELAFRITDGNNTPFNGFQLIATPIAPKADILSMSLASNPPSIQNAVIGATSITLTVPFGTNVTNLAPTYVLWPGATCATPSGTARNFTTPQTYSVTSSDSLVTKNYSVSVVIAAPLPEFTLSAPANWDGRTTITSQPVISNLALLQANNGTNFTYNWTVGGVAVTQTVSPSVMTLTRSQGNGPLVVTLTMNNGTENVTRTTTIAIQQPSTDPWVERTPLANEKPIANQFFARNPFTNLGTLYYRGTQSGTPNDVFLKVYRTPAGGSEILYSTTRQALTSGAYNFSVTLEAGLFTYRVEYGTRTASVDTNVATVNNLFCGDAFIIEGQSNAQATANDDNDVNGQVNTAHPWVKTYDASLGWGPAYAKPLSPEWGSKVGFWGMKLAQDLVAQHSMPICIINGALGGTNIDQHLGNPANRTVGAGTYDIYANLLNRVIAARLNHGIRGIFWHQGESDAASFGSALEPDYLSYERNFLNMSSTWKLDYPNFQRYIMFQIAPNPCSIGPFASEIREIQRQLPRLYSNMSLVATLAVPGYGGCHYTKAGYENLSARVLPVVNRDFYGVVPTAAVTPANLVKAYFANSARTAIALQFDQPMSWSSFSLPNYHINDISGLVTSGSASGNIVTLQLSSAANQNSTIDYVKDTWNFNESTSTLLFGANATPALTFANVPIETSSPYQSWINDRGLIGPNSAADADPDLDGLKNILEYVLGSEPNAANPGFNSSSLLPTSLSNSSGNLIFSFKRKRESIGNVNLVFQWTADLSFPALNTITIGAVSSSSDGVNVAISSFDTTTDNVIITVPAAKAIAGKLFGRLRANAP